MGQVLHGSAKTMRARIVYRGRRFHFQRRSGVKIAPLDTGWWQGKSKQLDRQIISLDLPARTMGRGGLAWTTYRG